MIENILYAFILVLSLTLATISVRAYRRSRSNKILLVTIAFLLFFWEGVLFTVQLFWDVLDERSLWILAGLLDVGILASLFFAVLKS